MVWCFFYYGRLTIRKRQREGIIAAKKQGRHLGRPKYEKPENWDEVIADWKAGSITGKQACRILGISRSTLYRMTK